jgi:ferredoxin
MFGGGHGHESYDAPDLAPPTPSEIAEISSEVHSAMSRMTQYWDVPEPREPVKFTVVETEGKKHELIGYEGDSVREVITRARAKVSGFPFDQCCRAEAQSPQKYPTHDGPNCTACHVYVRDEDLVKMDKPTSQEAWQLNYVLPEQFTKK